MLWPVLREDEGMAKGEDMRVMQWLLTVVLVLAGLMLVRPVLS